MPMESSVGLLDILTTHGDKMSLGGGVVLAKGTIVYI